MTTEMEIARQLSEFLTQRDPYTRVGVLEARVRTEITSLAATIAREIVAAHPSLREVIERRATDLVLAALRDDGYLSDVVTAAVAQGLGQLVRTRTQDVQDDEP